MLCIVCFLLVIKYIIIIIYMYNNSREIVMYRFICISYFVLDF